MSEQENTNNRQEVINNQFYTSATALQIRLNVDPLLMKLEMDLRGLEERWDDKTGSVILEESGEPLMNNMGIKNYLSFVRSVINVQVVQGNLDEDTYADYMYDVRLSIAKDLMINRHKYDLDLDNYNGLINKAMLSVRGFLTRPIGNKERDSYSATMKSIESSQTMAKGGGLFKI